MGTTMLTQQAPARQDTMATTMATGNNENDGATDDDEDNDNDDVT